MDDPTSRLPVSCTVFVVDNQMEGPNGIEAAGALLLTPYGTALDVLYTSQN